MGKTFEYYGIFLNEDSRRKLRQFLSENERYSTVLDDAEKIFLDHCTILHCSQLDGNENALNWCEACENEEVFGKAVAIGWNNFAMAVKVEFPGIPIVNKNPHITIATFNGGKPFQSNKITGWIEMEAVEVSGNVLKRG